MVHVLGVDGNALVHRAYHAGKHDPEHAGAAADGPWVTGIVVRMLAQAWRYGPFDGVVVGFDHEHNVRKDRWPEYKAHRPDKDDALEGHLAAIPRHLDGCGFTVVVPAGLEADDVMAGVAAGACDRGWRASVLSPDRDLLPLACEHVTVLQPTGMRLRACTPERVRRDHGVPPHRYRLYAALRGDPSDGLPGVAGIGPKTAARLMRQYRDVEELYAHLPFMATKVERALRAGRDRLERNLEVMAPRPVDVDLDRVAAEGVDCDLVDLELGSLGLRPVAGRFRGAIERPLPPPPDLGPPPPDPDDLVDVTARPLVAALDASDQAALF